MRIPSQFNQDSLYRPQNRPRGSQSDQRRLFRLFLALVLVLVVMQQASRPELYRVFFGPDALANDSVGLATYPSDVSGPRGDPQHPPQGATFTTLSDPRTGTVHSDSQQSDSQRTESRVGESNEQVRLQDRLQASDLVEELLPTDQRQWTVGLSRWISGRPIPLVPSTIESVQIRLNELEQLEQSQRSGWQRMLQSFAEAAAAQERDAGEEVASSTGDATLHALDPATGTLAPAPRDRELAMAMLAAIDEQASSRVVDGSVWRSGDFDSLYRFLDQSDQQPRSGVTRTSVIPLLQQPEVFRNQWVSIHGRVARVERIEAQDNPYAITHYWQLWLRPNDGADRPMVAIVRDLPESIAAISATASKLEGPEIVVAGQFLKRLAYTSGLGADLAPVVVGRIIASPFDPSESISGRQAELPSLGWATILPIAIACVLGLLAAIVVMWQTSVSARRGRELRAAQRAIELTHDSLDMNLADHRTNKDDA